jgi:hypothetical protein
MGEYTAYGVLFAHAFRVAPSMVKLVQTDMAHVDRSAFKVGVHIRLGGAVADARWLSDTTACIEKISSKHSNCVVLLATNEPETIHSLRSTLKQGQSGCSVFHQNLSKDKDWSSEHGPWTGAGAVADIEMLLNADAVLVHAGTTFGDLIKERALAANIPAGQWGEGAQCRLSNYCEPDLQAVTKSKLITDYDFGLLPNRLR